VDKPYTIAFMQINNFDEVHVALRPFMVQENMKGSYKLNRIKALTKTLGNPQDKLKVVHVAGTSGKTSTSYYIVALLQATGAKVGLTVSPHIDEVNERVQINLDPLPEAEFCQKLSEFLQIVEKTKIKPTYFELLVAFAYWYFALTNVDYAVIEVGLGGLLDGTNIVNNKNKVCVITDISLDHTDILGNTLKKIATQKAGIITPGNQIFTYQQPAEAMAVINKTATEQHANLAIVNETSQDLNWNENLPYFQKRNWWLAKNAVDFIIERDKLVPLKQGQLKQTQRIVIPARMETIKKNGKTVILDGAHNTQKMQALAKAIKEKYAGQPVAVLLAVKKGHDFAQRADLEPLVSLASHIITTAFKTDADLPFESVDPKVLANHCQKLGAKSVEVINDPKAAYKALIKRPEKILLITGSFYFMNHIRPLLKISSALQ